MSEPLDPAEVLREAAYLVERAHGQLRRSMALRNAAAAYEAVPAGERPTYQAGRRWRTLPGVGETSAAIIEQALAGDVPDYVRELRDAGSPLPTGGLEVLRQLRGDLHSHTEESDGHAPLRAMAAAASALGREYQAVTDHSPRLRVAHGLTPDRLRDQVGRVRALNADVAPLRLLTGVEADILDDGALDGPPDLLASLDVVVASVHSKMNMDARAMTHRMVAAIANPRTSILGHATGRLIAGERATRPPSQFDAEVVFEACRTFDVAVEINSRPERLDPPDELLSVALELGCLFSIDTDAHAPGQLEWLAYGAEKAARVGIPAERIVNTWPVERVLAWSRPDADR